MTRLQNIGDTLAFIPALRTMRQAVPDAHITVLCKHAGGREILNNCPYYDDMLTVNSRGIREKLRLLREFRKRHLDYFIISPQDLGRAPWAFFGGARKIVGYPRYCNYGRWQKEKLPGLLDIAPVHDTTRTETENCLLLVEDVLDDLGLPLPEDYSLELEYSWYSQDDITIVDSVLAEKGIQPGQAFIVSAPFSKRPAKNWPADRFSELFTRMHNEWGLSLVLTGGPNEQSPIAELVKGLGPWCVSLAGAVSLAQCAVVLKRAAMFIGPDSGPAFLATAVRTPAVVLYGPADYYRWHPPVNPVPRIDIYHPVPCGPCRHQECPRTPTCMHAITLEEVWEACCEVHSRSGSLESDPRSNQK